MDAAETALPGDPMPSDPQPRDPVPAGLVAAAATPAPAGGIRRIRAVVHGVVQGVGFRWATAEHATEIGASGWVKNLADGTVLAEVEGTPALVDDMVEFLHRGSQFARVDRVEVVELAPEASTGFTIG